MPEYVPPIATLRARAAQLIGHQSGRGELKAMLAAICAAENAGTPIPADSTGQTWITEASGIINQADQDALAILVREFAEFVENAGGGGGGDAPAVIAPFPGIGDEGVFYSQQVRTTGATPQTFAVTSGALPTGWTLDVASGVISGTSPSPNGGLWEGEITITNTAGDVVYPFSILVNGAIAGIYWPGAEGINSPLQANVALTLTPIISGSTHNGIVVDFDQGSGGLIPGLTMADDTTGVLTGTIDASEVGNYYQNWTSGVLVPNISTPRITNYFGASSTEIGCIVYAPFYYGNWHGALPGSFTSAQIKALWNGAAAGPIPVSAGVSADLVTNTGGTSLAFPTTGVAYYQVFALARGAVTGTYFTLAYPGLTAFPCAASDIFNPLSLTPAWPTPYQSALVIDGVTFDVFVLAGGPTTVGFSWGWNAA